ncbi:hypothetical protein [Burkholderia sp. Cy-647]|nr:hypothetical protein [Burkholderia sp. Cy-647]
MSGHTDLNGGVISSVADPGKNSLTTGTLSFSDIQNHSDSRRRAPVAAKG